jgi:glycosyltransferase involved in cell wall biosynthesis
MRDTLGAFERINRERLKLRLVMVGGELDFKAPWLESRPWRLDRIADDLAEFDIGLMPMPDDEWARGKCGYKLLQYFAAGVPAVASPVGVSVEMVGTERGILASHEEEWVRALEDLATDPDARRQMGANGRALVDRDYSYDRWTPELARLIKEMA